MVRDPETHWISATPKEKTRSKVGRSSSPSTGRSTSNDPLLSRWSAEGPTPDAPAQLTYDSLPHADTPGIEDTAFSEQDFKDAGVLGPDAASVLMKIL